MAQNYSKLWTCPHCGKKSLVGTCDYSPIDHKNFKLNGITYQYYGCVCEECGKKSYAVYRNVGQLTAEEFNELTYDGGNYPFTDEIGIGDGDLAKEVVAKVKQNKQ